jgi:hypothetical protein
LYAYNSHSTSSTSSELVILSLIPLEVKVKVTLRLTVSQSVILVSIRSCLCGEHFLNIGRVCLLYMLLALASLVFLGSESLGTCHHILQSQILDLPFRRLLRLAGSRWKQVKVKVKVKVMLRPTVQSASLSWNKAHILLLKTRYLLLSDSCRLVDVRRSL